MNKRMNKYYKPVAALMGIALVAQMFLFAGEKTESKGSPVNSDDARVAAEISNMTGVKAEDILRLKNSGKTWNEVINLLKNQSASGQQNQKDERSQLLAETGLGDQYLEKLLQEGFTQEEIMEARLLVERVMFQLKEITEDKSDKVPTPVPDLQPGKNSEDDMAAYQKVAEHFNEKTAIYLSLKLKKEFGSLEAVLDEYLQSLQLELNLEQYLTDKKQYLQEKEEKSVALPQAELMTLAKLESKMLEQIQRNNAANRDDASTLESINQSIGNNNEAKSPLPENPVPQLDDVKPKNPAEEIMQEIQVIDPNKR